MDLDLVHMMMDLDMISLDLVLGTKNTEADEIKFLLRRSRHLARYKRYTLQIQTQ